MQRLPACRRKVPCRNSRCCHRTAIRSDLLAKMHRSSVRLRLHSESWWYPRAVLPDAVLWFLRPEVCRRYGRYWSASRCRIFLFRSQWLPLLLSSLIKRIHPLSFPVWNHMRMQDRKHWPFFPPVRPRTGFCSNRSSLFFRSDHPFSLTDRYALPSHLQFWRQALPCTPAAAAR